MVHYDDFEQYLFHNLLRGETNELKNRYLHIRWQSEKPLNDVSRELPEGLPLKETAVLKATMADTGISIVQLAAATGLSTSTIDLAIKSLKDKQIHFRTASAKQVKWQINMA